MNGRESFLYTFLVGLVAFFELLHITAIEIAERLARLNIEHALFTVFAGYGLGAFQQAVSFMWIVVDGNVDDVHIDGRHARIVAFYFHHLEHLEPVFLGRFLIAAVSVDVAHHIDGHVHLLIDFLLAQFLGKRLCQLVGLDDALHVHQEHDLVAFLSIVAVQVVLFIQVFLQSLDSRKETGTVAIVERMVDRVAQRLEDGVIVIVCHRPTDAACQKHDGCQKERPYCH